MQQNNQGRSFLCIEVRLSKLDVRIIGLFGQSESAPQCARSSVHVLEYSDSQKWSDWLRTMHATMEPAEELSASSMHAFVSFRKELGSLAEATCRVHGQKYTVTHPVPKRATQKFTYAFAQPSAEYKGSFAVAPSTAILVQRGT